MENNVPLVVNIFPPCLPHLLVLPQCACSIFSSSSLPLPLCLQAIFLSVDRAQEIISWCGRETPLTLWPRLAAINPHCFLGGGVGDSPTSTPSLPQSIWPESKVTDTLDSNTHQIQTKLLLTHLGGRERTHAAARDGASISDLIRVTEQHRAAKMSWSVTKILTVETNFIKWAWTLETLIMCCQQKWCEHYILPSLIEYCKDEISLTSNVE